MVKYIEFHTDGLPSAEVAHMLGCKEENVNKFIGKRFKVNYERGDIYKIDLNTGGLGDHWNSSWSLLKRFARDPNTNDTKYGI